MVVGKALPAPAHLGAAELRERLDTVEQLLAAERSISPILPDITPGAGLQGLSFPGSDDYFRTLGDQKPPEITL